MNLRQKRAESDSHFRNGTVRAVGRHGPLVVPPARVDILMSIEGVKFEEAWPNRFESDVGTQRAWFIGKSDLLKNKRAVGRHIDLHDAELLE
jgi:hypothetical protein